MTRPQALEAVAEAARDLQSELTHFGEASLANRAALDDALATLDATPEASTVDHDCQCDDLWARCLKHDTGTPAHTFVTAARAVSKAFADNDSTEAVTVAQLNALADAIRAYDLGARGTPPAASTAEAPLDDIAAIYARDAKDEDGHPDHLAGIESVWFAGDAAGYARRGREVVARLREMAAGHRRLASVTLVVSFQKHEESIADALEAAAKELEGR